MSDLAAVEGAALYAYGHSYLALDYFNITSGQRYINRIASRVRAGSLTNRAVGGSKMLDAATDAISPTPRAWPVGTKGIVVVDCTVNDIVFNGGGPAALRGYTHSLRALLNYLSLSTKTEESDPAVLRVGGAVGSIVDFSEGHNWAIRGGNSGSASFQFTGTDLVIGVGGLAETWGGQFDVIVDDTRVTTFDTDEQCVASGSRAWCPVAIPLRLPSGTHHVTVRPAGGGTATGDGPFLDYFGARSTTPPAILLFKALYLTRSGYAVGPGGSNDSTVDTYNAIIDAVAAELPNVIVVDAREGWDPSTMVGGDLLHPTARGHAHIADAGVAAMGAIDFAPGVTG